MKAYLQKHVFKVTTAVCAVVLGCLIAVGAQVRSANAQSDSGKSGVRVSDLMTTGPMDLYYDMTLGSDQAGHLCNGPGVAACKTLFNTCSKIPKQVRHKVHVHEAAGASTVPDGCALTGVHIEPMDLLTPAYIQLEGTQLDVPDAGGPWCLTTGTLAVNSARLTNNTFASIQGNPGSDGGGLCWADGGLRGFYLEVDPLDGGTPAINAIYDNTGNVIQVAGDWPSWVPLANDVFHIRYNATTFDAGLTIQGNPMADLTANSSPTNSAAQPDKAVFIFSGCSSGGASPDWWANNATNAYNVGGDIYVQKQTMQSGPLELGWVHNCPNVVWQYIGAENITSSNNNVNVVVSDSPHNAIFNSHFGTTAGNTTVFGTMEGSSVSLAFAGNVMDSTTGVAYAAAPSVTALATSNSTFIGGQLNVVSLANSWRGASDGYIANFNYFDARADKCELLQTGSAKRCFRAGMNSTNAQYAGSPYQWIRIKGGIYEGNGDTGGGPIEVAGGVVTINGGSSLVTTVVPISGKFGIQIGNYTELDISATSTITNAGAGSDMTFDGTNAMTFATANTKGRQSSRSGFQSIGMGTAENASVGTSVTGNSDSSGTPGPATQNVMCGRSAIASSASSVLITNNLVTAASQVPCILESTASGCDSVTCAPGSGNFTATCMKSGVATTSAAANFSWCTQN